MLKKYIHPSKKSGVPTTVGEKGKGPLGEASLRGKKWDSTVLDMNTRVERSQVTAGYYCTKNSKEIITRSCYCGKNRRANAGNVKVLPRIPSPMQHLARATGTNYCHSSQLLIFAPHFGKAAPYGAGSNCSETGGSRSQVWGGMSLCSSLLQPMPHLPGAPTSHSAVSVSAIEGSHCLGRRQTSLCLHLSLHPAQHRLLQECHMIPFIFSLSPGHLA